LSGAQRICGQVGCRRRVRLGAGSRAATVGTMANEHGQAAPRARLSAGTAFKVGFFGAFGAVVFSLLLALVVGVVALVLAALGVLPGVAQLFQNVTGS
jgi:hypothetical protein